MAHVTFRFDGKNPDAQKAAEELAAKLIKDISKETERNIRLLISKSIREGLTPDEVARRIRVMIGLTTKQGQAADRFRDALIEQGLTQDLVDKRVRTFTDKLIRRRAQSISRTEILEALNRGQELALLQAQEKGLLTTGATKVVILTVGACPICLTVAGRGPVKLGHSFSLPGPPFHIQCRCTIAIDTP